MPLLIKKGGAYAAPIAVSVKKNGVYTAVVGVFVKVDGAYQSVLGVAPVNPTLPEHLRLYTKTNFTESGAGPYEYASTSVSAAVGGTSLILAQNADGFITANLTSSTAGYIGVCFKTANDGAQTYGGNVLWSIYAMTLASYKIGISGGAGIAGNGTVTVPMLGDILKIERTGTTVVFSVAREATPTTWITLHTITGGTQEPLFPGLFSSAAGNSMQLGAFGGLSQYVPFVSTATVVKMDGNSLVYGFRNTGSPGVTVAYNLVNDATSPLFGSGITVTNLGVSGATWADMTATLPANTANYINMVIAWEGTNCISDGRSGLESAADATAYIAALQAVAPRRVVLMTALPRQGSLGATYPTVAAFNEQLDIYNTYIRANYKAMGACALCDVRPSGGVWDMGGDYSDANFAACDTRAGGTVWLETGGNNRIHMTDFGDTKIAALLEPVLSQITLRDA